MKRSTLLTLGFCSSFLALVAVAGDRGETALSSAPGGAEGGATGQETGKETGAKGGDAEDSASGATARKGRPASTATAVGIINDQVKDGNIKIEGETDTAPLP